MQETRGKSSEQTIESEIPIRLHVKCSAYCFPPEGYNFPSSAKSVETDETDES